MAISDFLPVREGDLIPWTENFIDVAKNNLAILGINQTDVDALDTRKSAFANGLFNAASKQADAKAATEDKNLKKDDLSSKIRVLAKQIQAKPGVPDNIKVQLGLKPSNPSPSPSGPFVPSDLTIDSVMERIVNLKWNRNNNPSSVIFIVEASGFVDKDFIMIDSTNKVSLQTTYRHSSGTTYFRVKAKKGVILTESSNIVVI